MSVARRALGERIIILYKWLKAAAEVLLALGLIVLSLSGEIDSLRALAIELRRNLASRWSLALAEVIGGLLSEQGLHYVMLGLFLDGAVSAFEGYSLWRGYRWGAWLVVVASALPLPLEVVAIVRHHRLGRVLLALANLAIVIYLASRILGRPSEGGRPLEEKKTGDAP
jgi:uncharacterized membrane protein (DUF2068 family)